MTRSAAPTPLVLRLTARIRERGPITFADYMRECLYDPDHGYYSRAETRRHADYYTSVDVHPIFGRLLARQLAEMWELLGRPAHFHAVEVGAGVGRLAAHILDFAVRALPEFYSALAYVGVEQSAARRAAHAAALAPHVAAGRVTSANELPAAISAGCIFSNELFDALPVHRVVSQHGALREMFVGLNGESFCGVETAPSTPALSGYFAEQGIALQEGQQGEVCLEACRMMEEFGRRLGRGFVLTVDYGHEAAELYNNRHMRGTLLAYQQHRASEDFYVAPGEQDLTAHVNFTALDLAGRRAGLSRTGLVSQSHFLLALGRANDFADLYDHGQSETDRLRSRLLLKNLIHPEGLGETFRVLLQSKGLPSPPPLTALSLL